jgi:hypothetical protein
MLIALLPFPFFVFSFLYAGLILKRRITSKTVQQKKKNTLNSLYWRVRLGKPEGRTGLRV